MERKGREVGKARSNALRTAVRDCRGPVFALAPYYRKHPVSGDNQPRMGRGPPRVPAGVHGRSFQMVPRLENYCFFAFLRKFLREKCIGAAGPS